MAAKTVILTLRAAGPADAAGGCLRPVEAIGGVALPARSSEDAREGMMPGIKAFLLLILSVTAQAAWAEEVAVEFIVTIPKEAKPPDVIYVAGGLDAVGSWKADGASLRRGADGLYRGAVHLPKGAVLEYKITRGSWETVEKSKDGVDIANRSITVKAGAKVEITVESWASPTTGPARQHSVTGDVRFHKEFASKHLGNERTLAVYVPPGYEADSGQRYPVLYMHDGQNIFDAATSFLGIEWQVDETSERLIKAGRVRPVIIVGIYNNADRKEEYTPCRDKKHGGGKGDLYAKFLVEEVKPFIDKEYRTLPDRKNTAVAGSSLGGLISLHICSKYPETFSMCGVVSPALMWCDGRVVKEAREHNDWMKGTRFWLDMGSKEDRQIAEFSKAVLSTRELVAVFDEAGLVPGRDYYYWEVVDGEHNEAHWAARFDKILLYFFGS